MPAKMIIVVHYPLESGRMVLRTDMDWDRNIYPAEQPRGNNRVEFEITTDRPYFYFKPCILKGSEVTWAQGSNYLAIVPNKRKEIYPHFFAPWHGRISEPAVIGTGSKAHRVRFYVPPGYDENSIKRFSVLYMHDGHNLFFPEEAFIGQTWEMAETMMLLDAMNAINKCIIVGISPNDRMEEYTQPGYEAYGKFLVETLKPAIDIQCRTLAGPENTVVMGSSLGGVVSFFLGWEYPHVFGKAACLSSTFGYKDNFMERVATEEKRKIQLYIDSGWPGDNYEVSRSLTTLLVRRGYVFGSDLLYFAFPNALHNEKSWALRTHIPLQFFLGKRISAQSFNFPLV
ncbi:MAG: hypothetical protein HY774_11365 [Acidobacteria bacterium]|nr:hypothetical protein [Acidobacteriota bacterium]